MIPLTDYLSRVFSFRRYLLTYDDYSDEVREAVVTAYPRPARFKEDIIQAFYDGQRGPVPAFFRSAVRSPMTSVR